MENGRLFSTGRQYVPAEYSNAYDAALAWMAGGVDIYAYLEQKTVTESSVTYSVRAVFWDRFDFSGDNGSVPADIASIIGSVLFREFDWYATAEFELVVPNTCTHSTENYHWAYDAENQEMVSVAADGVAENQTKKHTYVTPNGETQYYYELDQTVTLRHNLPWALEYTVENPGFFAFSPAPLSQNAYPCIKTHGTIHFFIQSYEWMGEESRIHCYGYTFANLFSYSQKQLYTVRLENVIDADGSNMIYVSVYNHDLQKTVLEALPMDDYYWNDDGVLYLQDSQSKNLSGVDLTINYIGNRTYRFSADYFELRIWENGINAENSDCFEETVVPPTCTAEGYTAHSCRRAQLYERNLCVLRRSRPGCHSGGGCQW